MLGERTITNLTANPDVPRLGFWFGRTLQIPRCTETTARARPFQFSLAAAKLRITPGGMRLAGLWPIGSPPIQHRTLAGSPTLKLTRWCSVRPMPRLLNSAKVVAPTCGTIAKEVVRKHFEIPAARSCLVTEQTPSIEAAGFEDGVNCVFATRSDVVERVSELLSDSSLLAAITDAGHELVQSRHRMIHRSQIHDWYVLNRSRGPNETIVQPRSVCTARIDETQR